MAAGGGAAPLCMVVLGMAGSGKTTFVQRLTSYLHEKNRPPYVINLDPAVHEIPFPANIDIRDTVKYKEVMKQYPSHRGVPVSLWALLGRWGGHVPVSLWALLGGEGAMVSDSRTRRQRGLVPLRRRWGRSRVCTPKLQELVSDPCYPGFQEEEKRKEQQEQLDRLHRDMGSVNLDPGLSSGGLDEAAAGPSDLILTRGNMEEDDEEAEDSDTDDIDHSVAESRLEEPAFQSFLQQTHSKYREKVNK
ncbi:GPN-loop GTPase 1 [Phyllobates terribilis]|uniref:GPN-loop GTPase 1 n=1 Tax=Phyllobates terribilis TaxID=111132 RepID=UPI003CCAA04B